MEKRFTKEEFKKLLTDALADMLDEANVKSPGAGLGIMLSGVLIIHKIEDKLFKEDDDDTIITITKEI